MKIAYLSYGESMHDYRLLLKMVEYKRVAYYEKRKDINNRFNRVRG